MPNFVICLLRGRTKVQREGAMVVLPLLCVADVGAGVATPCFGKKHKKNKNG